MDSFLKKELGVAMSGVKWDSGNFKLWQSTSDDVILFTPKQPVVAKGTNGRYQIAVSSYHQQTEDTYKITGGSAIFTITSAIQYDQNEIERLKEEWRATVVGSGRSLTDNPKFVPLNVRKGEARVLINEQSGTPDKAHNDTAIGNPGGANSFLVNLTELGAQEWVQGIKNKTAIPAGVKFSYEYLQMLPTIGAEVIVHGQRVFEHFSHSLNISADGFWYGGSAQIDAEWEKMTRDGVVEIKLIGTNVDSPEIEQMRSQLVTTFAAQAQQQLFTSLFEPKPQVQPAAAGNTGGWFGGANYAFKYKKATDITNLNLKLSFEGWTWLKASMDADCVTLFKELDESYVTEVNTQQSFPVSVVVDADPMLSSVAMTVSASEGLVTAAPVFGTEGGTARNTATSQNPLDVTVNYSAQMNFEPDNWPIIKTSGSSKVRENGNQIVVKPSAWVGRHKIYMFVQDGDKILPPSQVTEDDYLVVNVSFEGPHLKTPIKDSTNITPFNVLEFSYPLDPEGRPGQAKFSAFGVVGGNMIRANDQKISFDEEAVFILASKKGVQLVSKDTIFSGESSRGGVAERLYNNLTKRNSSENESDRLNETSREQSPQNKNNEIVGEILEIEYGKEIAFLIRDESEKVHRIQLRNIKLAEVLNNANFEKVRVELDGSGTYAEKISILLLKRSIYQ